MGYRRRYVAITYLKTIRQAARFVEPERAYLRTGDISAVTPEFPLHTRVFGARRLFVFREGKTRGVGIAQEMISTS